ncbi:NAD(P)H-hydrate dehydratase [Candidatus Saganbacteria bacterium]|nr:NAD(P)H-hydrate dehydratase [Candidatus Saganbacteria bacterium]
MTAEFFLPKRQIFTNKSDYGRVLIIAGSRNMSGAAWLAARAALRSGAGLVYLAVPQGIQKIAAPKTRETITIGLPETAKGSLSLKAYDEIKKIKADVAAIGPGLTTQPETADLVKKLITDLKARFIVLDADGLNCIADNPAILKKSKSKIIITPHPGEMSRLIGKKIGTGQKDRIKIAQATARKWGVEVVLKGAYTIIANRDETYINSSGNPGMASAGVGDVLTGMMAAFLAQGFSVKEAVYVHGLAGDLAAREKGEYGLIASDIVEKIPYAIQKIS